MEHPFFCDACGCEVGADDDSCPSCGQSFVGSRCPRCGHAGKASAFRHGCPGCGYLAPGPSSSGIPSGRRRREWSSKLYWALSVLLLIAGAGAVFWWIRG